MHMPLRSRWGLAMPRCALQTPFTLRRRKSFFLLYDTLRKFESPRNVLLEFMQSTYDAGATLGKWGRQNLERS
jgi:hypothetical protein